MTTSEVLSATWNALDEEGFSLPGNYERRIYPHSAYSLFAGISRPSNLIQFSLVVTVTQAARVRDEEARGFRLHRDTLADGHVRLRIELTEVSYRDVFLVVSSDILDKLLEINDENQTVVILQKRIDHWKKFMQASGPEGLTRSRQIGLFGELLVLRSLLAFPSNEDIALESWLGPNGSNQDFVLGDHAIEVKTTASNEPTRVQISNERQLDTVGLSLLFLCHIGVDEKAHTGLTLPSLVEEILNALPSHLSTTFLDSLAKAGYLNDQRDRYETRGYIERSRIYYQVSEEFPRIIPADLVMGVSEVSYQIDLSAAKALRRPEPNVLSSYFMGNS